MQRHALASMSLFAFALLPMSTSRAIAQAPLPDRPSITVTAFDYGTVAAQINGDPRTRGRLGRMGVRDGEAYAQALGNGASDLVVQKLVESDRFRVFERKQLEAIRREQDLHHAADDDIARARYVITGSVTRLGLNDKEVGGMAGGPAIGSILFPLAGPFALLHVNSSSTSVQLTARVVDTRTSKIIGSFTAEGTSTTRC